MGMEKFGNNNEASVLEQNKGVIESAKNLIAEIKERLSKINLDNYPNAKKKLAFAVEISVIIGGIGAAIAIGSEMDYAYGDTLAFSLKNLGILGAELGIVAGTAMGVTVLEEVGTKKE